MNSRAQDLAKKRHISLEALGYHRPHPVLETRMSKAWLPFFFLIALSAHSLSYPSSGQSAEVIGRVREVINGRSFVLCNDDQGCKTVALCGISVPPDGYPGWDRSLMGLHTLIGNQTVRCVPLGEGTICDG